jgi:hypothetical protein
MVADIGVVVESSSKLSRAVLAHVGSACPESEAEKIESTYRYPFVPHESPKYTTASDVYNFGQLFMQVLSAENLFKKIKLTFFFFVFFWFFFFFFFFFFVFLFFLVVFFFFFFFCFFLVFLVFFGFFWFFLVFLVFFGFFWFFWFFLVFLVFFGFFWFFGFLGLH